MPHHLFPRLRRIERQPCYYPPQAIAQRLQHRSKSFRTIHHRPLSMPLSYPGGAALHDRDKLIAIATISNPRIFLSAGEASGDHYGAGVIAHLRARLPQASFTGLGGTEMADAGQQRVVRAEDVAHMGFTEVVRHAPYIYAQYRKLVASIRRERPDVAILIDFPEVNFRLARQLKRLGVPVLWFVSPQLWAWKRGRLRLVQRYIDRMMVIFPFEAPFYQARGVDAEFVGHPLAALPVPTITREEYAAKHGLDPLKNMDCASSRQPAERDPHQPDANDAGRGHPQFGRTE